MLSAAPCRSTVCRHPDQPSCSATRQSPARRPTLPGTAEPASSTSSWPTRQLPRSEPAPTTRSRRPPGTAPWRPSRSGRDRRRRCERRRRLLPGIRLHLPDRQHPRHLHGDRRRRKARRFDLHDHRQGHHFAAAHGARRSAPRRHERDRRRRDLRGVGDRSRRRHRRRRLHPGIRIELPPHDDHRRVPGAGHERQQREQELHGHRPRHGTDRRRGPGRHGAVRREQRRIRARRLCRHRRRGTRSRDPEDRRPRLDHRLGTDLGRVPRAGRSSN